MGGTLPEGWLARLGKAGPAKLLARLNRRRFQNPEDGCCAALGSQSRCLPPDFLAICRIPSDLT